MKLAISNLAFGAAADTVYQALFAAGVSGVEVAPTRLGAWDQLEQDLLKRYKERLEAFHLGIPSLQAILFGVADATLLGDDASFGRLQSHIAKVSRIAQLLGAHVLVFGAPKNRRRGSLSLAASNDLAVQRFRVLAEIAHGEGVVIAVEPIPVAYDCDFLNSWQDVSVVVRATDHPALRLHLDTGCVLLAGDSISEAIVKASDILAHFHVAEPKLGNFLTPKADHQSAAQTLAAANYSKWLSIEMLEQPEGLEAVRKAVGFVTSTYDVTT